MATTNPHSTERAEGHLVDLRRLALVDDEGRGVGNLVVQRGRRPVELLGMPVCPPSVLPVGNGEDRSDEVESDRCAACRTCPPGSSKP